MRSGISSRDLLLNTNSGHRSTLSPARATLVYLGVALVFTWPLALGLTRDIPWDLGDSLLNAWILAWDAEHLRRFLSGELRALDGFWNANIFYPEPLTLAYSEHLFAQAVQILPVYAVTGNIILCYNLVFLSTFVLSGLGMYLFTRQVTGSANASFAAGLMYAFASYRVPQFSHVQVISSQWMPFVLYGLRKYFDGIVAAPSGWHWRALAGAGAALVAQNLSNGYFLLFFAPFVVAYAIFEIATRRLWANARVWISLSATAVLVALFTIPFLMPYLELRAAGIGPRSLTEVKSFSADVLSYWTSPPESRVWGRTIRAHPKTEGELFPTMAVLLLSAAAIAGTSAGAWARARTSRGTPAAMKPIAYVLLASAFVYVVFLGFIFTGNGFTQIGPLPISVRTVWPSLAVLVMIVAMLALVSVRARVFVMQWLTSVAAFALLAAFAAFLLSLGPEMRADGRLIGELGPYSFFYSHVPGFDGLRVPARYAMLVVLFLTILAGCGAAALERRHRLGGAAAIVIGALAVVEAFAAPIPLNGVVEETRYATPPPRVYTGDEVPPSYRFLKTLPAGTVLAEFPFGEWAYELRYVFYSTAHWHPLLNGYSGHFPVSYNLNATHLRRPLEDPERAWDTLMKSGATHAIVHEQYYRGDEGHQISSWLLEHGARQIGEFEGDLVFALR